MSNRSAFDICVHFLDINKANQGGCNEKIVHHGFDVFIV